MVLKKIMIVVCCMSNALQASMIEDGLALYRALHNADQQVLQVGRNVDQYKQISDALCVQVSIKAGNVWQGQSYDQIELCVNSSHLKYIVRPKEQLICAQVRQNVREFLEQQYGPEHFLSLQSIGRRCHLRSGDAA